MASKPSCDTCARTSQMVDDPRLGVWLKDRGLAFCFAYSKALKRDFLITLQNAGGPVCSGRWYKVRAPGEAPKADAVTIALPVGQAGLF